MTLEPKSSSIVITAILESSHPHLWILSQLLMHLMLPLALWLSPQILQLHRPTAPYLCLTPHRQKAEAPRVHQFSSVGTAYQLFCLADWWHYWCCPEYALTFISSNRQSAECVPARGGESPGHSWDTICRLGSDHSNQPSLSLDPHIESHVMSS